MNQWKLVLAVIGGSVLVLVLVVLGLSRLVDTEKNEAIVGVEGESRLLIGEKEAKVTIVEFSDFQCPACTAAQTTVKRVLENQNVKLVYRHLPLTQIHPNAYAASLAVEAAYNQEKFKEYHDLLYEDRSWVEEKDPTGKLVEMAEKLGLDKSKFETDLKSRVGSEAIKVDEAAASKYLVNATPTFFVNGIKTNTSGLEQLVNQELKK